MSFSYWGIAGSAVIALGCLIPLPVFKGKKGERYNPLNHFISELGEVHVSRFAGIFNASLVAAGILFVFFMVEFGKFFGTFMAFISAAAGVYSSLSCAMVGFCPMNKISMHMVSSMSFFYGGLATIVLFGITAAVDGQGRMPDAFIFFAAAVALVFAVFLLIPRFIGKKGYALDPDEGIRPSFWLMPFVEWLVLVGIVGWIATVSVYFL